MVTPIPVRFPDAAVFARVRDFFHSAAFHEKIFTQLTAEWKKRAAMPAYGDPIPSDLSLAELLVRLFSGSRATREDFLRLAGQGPLDDLHALGLISFPAEDTISATVRVRPLFGLYVISDLPSPDAGYEDFVLGPDEPDTLKCLEFVPMTPCGSFLEACGGSGIAALAAATRGARHAWCSDIAERCTAFARFSAALSGVGNLTAVTGDTFESLPGLAFDRIIMNPPFVPALHRSYLFRDGGQDGEQITRKHIQDLPGRLNPGGRLYCRGMATDRKGEPFEQRIRHWLGDGGADFDIALHVSGYIPRSGFILNSIRGGHTTPDEIGEWEKAFEEMGLDRLMMAVAVIQRRECDRPTFTVRRDEGPLSGNRELEWLLQFETARAARGRAMFLHSRLSANPVMALNILQTLQPGDWLMRKLSIEVVHPYPLKHDVDPLLVQILPTLDGTRTGAELYHSLVDSSGPLATEEEFADLLAELAGGGFLSVEGLAPPAVKSH